MNTLVKIKVEEHVSVEVAAKTAMQGADSTHDGAKRLLEMAGADPDLMRALMGPWEHRAAIYAVRSATRKVRVLIWEKATREAADNRVVALVHSNAAMLLEFPLPGGKLLRNALNTECEEAANFYRRQAVDMVQKSAWLRLIAKNVPKGKTVGQALDELTLALFKEETKNG